jgi:exopolyphosphatase/pppGpp-phosphohydrolase
MNIKITLKLTAKLKLFIAFFILFQNAYSQTLFGGIEIGSKGVKMTVVDVQNAKKNLFELKKFWTENAGIAKGISIDGNLAKEDIENASNIVLLNYQKMINEYKIDVDKIFIVAFSGVGMAKNTDELTRKIKELTQKDLEIISSKLEAKLLLRGCIPQQRYTNSLIIDIGGGNTKGGYIETVNGNNIFYPLNMNLGTVTLTEKINKKGEVDKVSDYIEASFAYMPTLNDEVNTMLLQRPLSKEKKNVYMSGGAVWAFYTLSNAVAATENNTEFTLAQVQYYNTVLQNNFQSYIELATKNEEVDRVLKTYSQKHLISANNLLMKTLENLGDLSNKRIYFAKQGQIAWLLSYVADSAKGTKVVY